MAEVVGDAIQMIEITINEARKRLMAARPGLYAGFVSSWADDEDISSKSSAYESKNHSAVIIKTFRFYGSNPLVWYICDTGNSDMAAAHAELSEKNYDHSDVIMIYARELEGSYSLIFSCIGKPYDDSDIRFLSETDREQILSITTVPDDDNEFGKSISQNLLQDFSEMIQESNSHMLGIFDGETLAGAINIWKPNNDESVSVGSIFIPRNYRGRGYAPRLIRAGMAIYPGARFIYNCGSDNYPSMAAAKSAGFVCEGTWDFLNG